MLENVKRKPRPRRWRRRVLIALAALLLAIVGARLAAPFAVRRWGLPWVEREAARVLGGRLEVGGFEWRGLEELRFTGVEIAGPPGALVEKVSLEELKMSLTVQALLGGEIVVREVEARGLRATLDLEGSLPGIEGAGAGEEAKRSLSIGQLPHVRLAGASLELRVEGRTLAWRDLEATLEDGRLAATWESFTGELPVDPGLVRGRGRLGLRLEDGSGGLPRLRDLSLDVAGRPVLARGKVELGADGAATASVDMPSLGLELERAAYEPVTREVVLEAAARQASVERVLGILGIAVARGDAEAPGSPVEASASGRATARIPLAQPEAWTLEADLESGPLAVPPAGVRAEATRLHAARAGSGPLTVEAFVVGVEALSLKGAAGSGRARLGWGGGSVALELEDLVVRLGDAAIEGEGALDLSTGTMLRARLHAADVDMARLAGELSLDGEVPGRASLTLEARGPYHDLGRLEAWATIDWRGDGDEPPSLVAEASLASCVLEVPRASWTHGDDRADIALETGWTGTGKGFEAVWVRVLRARGLLQCVPFDQTRVATLEWRDGEGILVGALASESQGSLEFWGRLAAEGFADAHVSGRFRDVAEVAAAVGLTTGGVAGEGSFAATFEARLPVARATADHEDPAAAADFRGEAPAMLAAGVLDPWLLVEARFPSARIPAAGEALEELSISASVLSDRDSMALEVTAARDGLLEARARAASEAIWDPIPRPRPGGHLEAHAVARVRSLLALLRPAAGIDFADGAATLTAEVDAAMDASGLPRLDDVAATVEVADGTLRPPIKLPPLGQVEARLRLQGQRLAIERLRGRAFSAPVELAGWVDLDLPWTTGGFGPRQLDVHVDARSVLLVNEPDLRLRGDVDLRWQGPVSASAVTGTLKITRGYYQRDVALTHRSGVRLPLSLFSITSSPFDRAKLAVRVVSDRTLFLRNNLVSTRASSDLLLGGTGRDPTLTGLVSSSSGRVTLLAANLSLRHSFIELLPADPLNPRLSISLGKQVRDHEIDVLVGGTYEEPEVVLSSSPPLESEKILLLISTGLTLEQIEDRGVDRVAATQAAAYIAQMVVHRLSRGDPEKDSFLSRLRFESEAPRFSGYDDIYRVEFRALEDVLLEGDEVYLQAERDTYGDYNVNAGVRFELR